MNGKLLNLGLILTSLIGYLEWGGDNQSFLFQTEYELLSKVITDPQSIAHPFIVLPLLGQLLLVITLFQKNPNKILTYIGLGGLAVLLFFMFLIGLMSFNIKILLSTIPFLVLCVLTIRHHRKKKSQPIID